MEGGASVGRGAWADKEYQITMTQIEIIKKEIERRTYNAHEMSDSCPNKQFYEGKDVAYGEILSLIESLEQKSQCDGCVNDKGCVTCVDGNMKETQPKGIHLPFLCVRGKSRYLYHRGR